MRNRGVNDPTWRAARRPAPHSGVVHATVPGVHVGDREVGLELAMRLPAPDATIVRRDTYAQNGISGNRRAGKCEATGTGSSGQTRRALVTILDD